MRDGWMIDKVMDGWMNDEMVRWIDGCYCIWMNEWIDEYIDEINK